MKQYHFYAAIFMRSLELFTEDEITEACTGPDDGRDQDVVEQQYIDAEKRIEAA